ncbi:MAG: CopD family protein, partial [Ktedonobacterales bacterium]
VVMLSATGVVLAWEQVQRPINVVATPYGWALIAKLLVVAGVLIAAFVARRMRAGDRRFRWWAVEVAGVAVVLALAGLLASLAPPV